MRNIIALKNFAFQKKWALFDIILYFLFTVEELAVIVSDSSIKNDYCQKKFVGYFEQALFSGIYWAKKSVKWAILPSKKWLEIEEKYCGEHEFGKNGP